MSISAFLETFRSSPRFARNVAAWERIPARSAILVSPPAGLHPHVRMALRVRGLSHLYSHQAEAVQAAVRGENVALVTGTSSGKTLAYNLPILDRMLANPESTAMYLFPTKALAQDQAQEIARWETALGEFDAGLRMYDGDTPHARRAEARRSARLLITNPDMLHAGILPHHTRWADYFSRLHFVVLDEMHIYRGVFGSHMANVLRRLKRICAFYGSAPQFLMASATIANPGDLAERLLELPVRVVDLDGSPRAEKHLLLYNPPLTDPSLNIRRSYLQEAVEIAAALVRADVQTALFARTRRSVELLLGFLRERCVSDGLDPRTVRGYRAGYLSEERREIEAGLRNGSVRCVVATSALELGVDIGSLGASVLAGYPGTIASFWQQAGRAGRRDEESIAVMVASPSPLDQFLVQHPEFLLNRSPEHARINPENLAILAAHLRCASFELPFSAVDKFGAVEIAALLEALAEEGDMHRSPDGEYAWVGEDYPAARISLRTAGADRVVIQELAGGKARMIGEVDRATAPFWVHTGAMYLHEGRSYEIESLDWETGIAMARPREADYYTEPTVSTELKVISVRDACETGIARRAWGDLHLSAQAVAYRKLRRQTGEVIGNGEIELPAVEFQTIGCWLWLAPDRLAEFEGEARELLSLISPIEYGPSWPAARKAARARDEFHCARCGAPERGTREHDVHHRIPFRSFGYIPVQNENHLRANEVENLITLCAACHQRLEAQQGTHTALGGLAHAMHNLAPLYLMCDARDIGCEVEVRGRETSAPTVTFYDDAPEGLGLSEELFALAPRLLESAAALIHDCVCEFGCPACVGPVAPGAGPVKAAAARLAEILGEHP